MGKAKLLSLREQGKIDAYCQLGLAKRDIARRLRRSVCSITTYLSNKDSYGKKWTGRSRILTARDMRRLGNAASNKQKSIKKIKAETNIAASNSTIIRALKRMNMQSEKVKRAPFLSKLHKEARIKFTRDYMQQNWENIWFTDEKKWNLDGPDRYFSYWHDLRKEPIVQQRRQNGGGSVMIWAGISGDRKTNLCFVEGNMNSEDYQRVLRNHFLPSKNNNDLLMQDNASIHVSHSTKNWLANNNIQTINWPSRSPDLNPIENIWGIMVRRVYIQGKQYNSIPDLKNAILSCWNRLSRDDILNCTRSMPDRIFQCITKKGSLINY